jgi:hypothetical protein
MPFVPYQHAKDITDRFLELLANRRITAPAGTAVETELLSLVDLLDIWRDPKRIRNRQNEAPTIRSAAAIHDLAAKVLSSERLPDFSSFEEHLKMIAEAEEFTTIGQIGLANALDDISRKMAELYVGCLAIHCGEQVVLDHPHGAKGDNPDILLTWEKRRWALAVKTLVSARNGQTIFERIQDGARQIDACAADCGMIVINAKNVIGHNAFWTPPQPFRNLDAARDALRSELRALVDVADNGRQQAEWDALFAGKAVPPVIFIGQSVTYLPLGGGAEAPTPVKAMVTDACNRTLDPEGVELAECLNHWMQSILLGLPGPPPT